MIDAIFSNPKPLLGNTPDACHSLLMPVLDFFLNASVPEPHADNGQHGRTPDQMHAFQLAEGRIGRDGQTVNMTVNGCTRTNANGICNAPVTPVTPYIWSYPLFDARGQYTISGQTQIFPTYYVYENGKLVKKIRQSAVEDFVRLNSTSQVRVGDIK